MKGELPAGKEDSDGEDLKWKKRLSDDHPEPLISNQRW